MRYWGEASGAALSSKLSVGDVGDDPVAPLVVAMLGGLFGAFKTLWGDLWWGASQWTGAPPLSL